MNQWKSISAFVLTGLVCSGCTTISLATAQRDLDGLLDRRARGFDEANGWRSARETSRGFVDLANRARASAGEMGIDPRTKVSFLRIAAAAAWKAGPAGADDFDGAVGDGVNVCKKLLSKNSAPPRDCAFLFIVRALQWHDLKRDQITGWSAARASHPESLAAKTQEIQALGANYYPNTLRILVANCSDIARIPGLDESFGEYLALQANAFADTILVLRNVARDASREAATDQAMMDFVAQEGGGVHLDKAIDDMTRERFLPGKCPPG